MPPRHTFDRHDEMPSVKERTGLLCELKREWVQLNNTRPVSRIVTGWAANNPVLAGCTRPGDIVDLTRSTDDAQDKDEILLCLIRLFQSGQQLAGRVLLQAMLPALTSRVSQIAHGSPWRDDQMHIMVAEFWQVITGYPARRTAKVATYLLMETLHQFYRERRQEAPMFAWVDVNATPAGTDPEVGQRWIQAENLLKQCRAAHVLTEDEADLMEAIYLRRETSIEAGDRLGIAPCVVRKRCSRATHKIKAWAAA